MTIQGDRVVAVIQARLGASRLLGKVLMPLGDGTLLDQVVRRTRACPLLAEVVVATTTSAKDEQIVAHCDDRGYAWFRGSEEDVLDRYYRAAKEYRAEHIVRVTADDPLIDPDMLSALIRRHLDSGADYTHNVTVWGSGTPVGTGCEVLTFAALEASWREGKEPHHREHVTDYVYEHGERFRTEIVPAPPELWRPQYRLTVDTPEDLQLIREIYRRLYSPGEIIDLADVIRLLDHEPALLEINRHVVQR